MFEATKHAFSVSEKFMMNPLLLQHLTRRSVLGLLVASSFGAVAKAFEPQAAKKSVKLLTIGNSFSANATRFLTDIVKSRGLQLIHQPIVVGGASLELHWSRAAAHEKDSQDPAGLYGKRSLKQELMAQAWDYVTIQQASIKSHNIETYRPFAKRLQEYIQQHAPTAKLLMHQTWAYRVDDPRFSVQKHGEPATQTEMYEQLRTSYRTIGQEIGAGIIPVGDAFYLADKDPQWGYQPDTKFDFLQKSPTGLPQQNHSLHVGWRLSKQADGDNKLSIDGHHANVAGEYLGACVWFEVLYNENVVGTEFVAPGLTKDYAQFLQMTAHQAVMAYRAT